MNKSGVYLEGVFPSRHKECKVTMVLDTGNLNQSVMSYKCLQSLGLGIISTDRTATGVDGKDINILGETELITFRINQPCEKFFREKFIVIDKMSVPINLSCNFMMRYSIECRHSPKGNVVCIDKHELPLYIGNINIISQINARSNKTYTFQEPHSEIPGLNPNQKIPVAEIGPQKVGLIANETIIIPSSTIMSVDAFCKVSNLTDETGLGYVSPRPLGKRNVILLEGVVSCKGPKCKVNISNYEEVPVTLQKGSKIGFMYKATEIKAKNVDKLTAAQRLERIRFITEKLNITNNPLLENISDQRRLINIFLNNFDCISTSTSDIGNTSLHTFDLKLLPGTKPFRCRPIKVNPDAEEALNDQINKWLMQGVIEEGDSPWSHPIFAVKKRAANVGESSLRWVLDFRRLNNVTERLAAPIPNISDSLERLGHSKVFTVLDLTSAYHAMGMTKEASMATAFCTKQKQYLFLRMPFGLTNAPASFCQLMSKVYELNPELMKFSLSYLDDIIIHSNTVQEHFVHLEKVLECLVTAGLKLNIGKCHLFAKQVKFLGHNVSGDGIEMDKEYLNKIAAWPLPVTGKDIQRYLGFINYYSTYFKDFARVTQPLNTLRNLKKIEWTEDLTKAFQETKDLFCQHVRKAYPDWNAGSFILDTDFSSKAFGVVLSQIQDGKEVMINCTSKVCNEAERNYSSWKGELCALIHALKRFTHILRYRPFIVRTDSTCLQSYKTWSKLDISGVAIRWILYLQSFDFDIVYRSGKEHINADYLSRDMLAEQIIKTDIESIENDNNLLDQIYNLNFSVKEKRTVEFYDLKQRLRSQYWSKYTEEDEILKKVRDLIVNNNPPNSAMLQTLPYRAKQILKYYNNLRVLDGMVVFSQPTAVGKNVDRVCVPIGLYNEVYSYAHRSRSAGHKGVTETVHKINQHFYMPYLQKYVEFQVANCIQCLNRKPKPKHNHKIIRSAYSGEVLETLYVDHIGPISASRYKGRICTHILILVDGFSRFTFAYAVPDCSTKTVVDTLAEEFVPEHGLFKRLVSDRGSAFTSTVFNQLMDRMNILKYHIPVRSPNSNFQERYNQGLMKYLRTDLTFEERNWPKKLAYATLCANTSFNSRLGTTPFFLFHGRDPVLPLDLFNPLTKRFDEINSKGFLKVIDRIEKGWQLLKDNTNRYLRVQNLHRQDKPLTENTICYIYFNVVRVGLSKKLQGFFLGPMIVTERYSNSLYLVNPLDSCPIKSKKPIVVARDKIYPIDTKLELCPKEWVSLDLKPSEYIHPDDCVMLDKNVFHNLYSFSGEADKSVEDSQNYQADQPISEAASRSKAKSERKSLVEAEISSVSDQEVTDKSSEHGGSTPEQVHISKIMVESRGSLDLNMEPDQKGEESPIGLDFNKLAGSNIVSTVNSSIVDISAMSVSSSEDIVPSALRQQPSDILDNNSGASVVRGRGRPRGSVKKDIPAVRRSKRNVTKTIKHSVVESNRSRPRYSVAERNMSKPTKYSIADKLSKMTQSYRKKSRATLIEKARSIPSSRRVSLNDEEQLEEQ